MITELLIPYFQTVNTNRPLYLQDNAKPYVFKEMIQWLEENNINLLKHPALSSDLNPIENLWSEISTMLY